MVPFGGIWEWNRFCNLVACETAWTSVWRKMVAAASPLTVESAIRKAVDPLHLHKHRVGSHSWTDVIRLTQCDEDLPTHHPGLQDVHNPGGVLHFAFSNCSIGQVSRMSRWIGFRQRGESRYLRRMTRRCRLTPIQLRMAAIVPPSGYHFVSL